MFDDTIEEDICDIDTCDQPATYFKRVITYPSSTEKFCRRHAEVMHPEFYERLRRLTQYNKAQKEASGKPEALSERC